MLRRGNLRSEDGSVVITALMVMLIVLPLGLALLSIVDTQARDSGRERTRDRAFNLADSALTSAAFSMSRFAWPSNPSSAPSNTSATGSSAICNTSSYGATLGAATNPGSATSKLQPNLNATYDDSSYDGATWQINVCDDDTTSTAWNNSLLTSKRNYDENGNQMVWLRSQATVAGRTRVLAALVKVTQTSALSPTYGLMTGRMNSELTNTAGALLSNGLVGNLAGGLLGIDPLVAPDPTAVTTPPTSGVTAVRCGVLDGCLTGALAAASTVSLVDTLINDGKLVQSTETTATSDAAVAQLKQQAITSNTYVATTAGSASSVSPPACTIPAGADSSTIVYIEQVGTTGAAGTSGGQGDQFCSIDVTSGVAFKALIIGSGRVVLRGNNTNVTNGTTNTFKGLVYALNLQRKTALGDAALPAREVIRIDQGAHVKGGVAADGKSAQVGIYPPPVCTSTLVTILGATVDIGTCGTGGVLATLLGIVTSYNPAIQSDVSLMNSVKVFATAGIVAGTYHDVAGETR
jgi:Tfp pilus assembly protein PilX